MNVTDALIQIFSAAVGTLGFAFVFNIRGKKVFFAALGGFLGWVLFLRFGLFLKSEVIRYLIVSIVISIYAELMARILKTPTTLFSVVCLIPLVPGGGLYYTMTNALSGNFGGFIEKGGNTLLLASALSLGVVIVNTSCLYVKRHLIRKKQ